MTRPVPPALAFYARHPHDNDALAALEGKPDGVDEAEWQKWLEVIGLASQQAGALVMECRDDALEVLGKRVEVLWRNKMKNAAQNWCAWADVSVVDAGKGGGKAPPKLSVGVGVAAGPQVPEVQERAFVCPYLWVAGGQVRARALREALRAADVPFFQGDTAWFGEGGNVVLAMIPLREGGDLEKIVAESRRVFEGLAAGVPKIASWS